jgi:hypothetical protein
MLTLIALGVNAQIGLRQDLDSGVPGFADGAIELMSIWRQLAMNCPVAVNNTPFDADSARAALVNFIDAYGWRVTHLSASGFSAHLKAKPGPHATLPEGGLTTGERNQTVCRPAS